MAQMPGGQVEAVGGGCPPPGSKPAPGLNRTARTALNTLSNYLRFLVGMAVFFALTPMTIRWLGAEAFGLWSLIQSVLGFFALLDLGLGTAAVKFSAECRAVGDVGRRNRIASTLMAVYCGIALLAACLVAGLSPVFGKLFGIPASQTPLALGLLWVRALRTVVLSLPLSLFRNILFGEQAIWQINVVQAAGLLLYGTASAITLLRGGSLMALAWVSLASMAVEYSVYVFLAYRTVPGLRVNPGAFDRRLLRETASFSGYAFAVNVASLVLLRTDPVIVQLFFTLQAVAVYSAASRVAEYSVLLTKQFINVLAPLSVELKADPDPSKIRFVFVNCARFSLAPAAVLSIALFAAGRHALRFWLGAPFEAAMPVLAVLLLAMLLSIPQMIASSILSMTGRHRITGAAAVGASVLNVGASVALTFAFGMAGVAVGTLVTVLVVDVGVVLAVACRDFGVRPLEYARRVAPSILVPGAVQYGLTWGIIRLFPPGNLLGVAAACAPGAVLFLSLFWLCFVEPSEKRLFREKLLRRAPGGAS